MRFEFSCQQSLRCGWQFQRELNLCFGFCFSVGVLLSWGLTSQLGSDPNGAKLRC